MNINECVNNADLVFVGIGNEMQVKMKDLMKIPVFSEKFKTLQEKEENEWIIPFLIRHFLKPEFHQDIINAYKKLEELVQGKNYFIVSLSTDDLLRYSNLDHSRMVFPCGTYELLQCENNCQKKLYQVDDSIQNAVDSWIEGEIDVEELVAPRCSDCGAPLIFNQYGFPMYNEDGYLENWTKYTKWLQGTVNKKLCILELGVGMEFPSIIRWPLEKVCFYNQKSSFFRVHETLFQLSEEIKDRGVSIKENPITFLNNM